MEFISGLLWGTGLSLGICVGLVTWVFLRTAVNWLLGITSKRDAAERLDENYLAALQYRNVLTIETNELLERIAVHLE